MRALSLLLLRATYRFGLREAMRDLPNGCPPARGARMAFR